MFVIGTSGHVDHGKSTLVNALTGIDPDRLSEEKLRGLTIDLGFAWLTTPAGKEVGIVDVPGHERFVHNMLAGCGSLDGVIFVVDGSEGWKAQSEEHLAILDLLGVERGIIAVTKTDIAREIGETTAQIAQRIAGTALEGSPIIPVSAKTGNGISELVQRIDSLLDDIPPRDAGRPRLFVDRSFSIKGSGTVVTGTLTHGALHVADEIEVLPHGTRARIRGMQSHKATLQTATPTSRVALNLAAIERSQIARGDAVVLPGRWLPTNTIDVELKPVRSVSEPVTSKSAYLLYLGSSEVHARLRMLDPNGTPALARITCDHPVVAQPNDRFVLRDIGRSKTVAGGRVLDAHPQSLRVDKDRLEQLRARAATGAFADATVRERKVVRTEDLEPLSGCASASGERRLPSYWISRSYYSALEASVLEMLSSFHAGQPIEKGLPKDTLRQSLGVADARFFSELLDSMDRVRTDGANVRLESHRVIIEDPAREALLGVLRAARFAPPSRSDLEQRFGALVKALIEYGDLVSISAGFVLSRAQLEEAKDAIAASAGNGITASAVKELLGTTRKYAIPLLEHLDSIGFTKRNGDVRVVR